MLSLEVCSRGHQRPTASVPRLHSSISITIVLMNFQCRLIDKGKACEECEYGGTYLLCFEFRLEHLVDQMLDCEGEKLFMTLMHRKSELTVGTEVQVTFHDFCIGDQSLSVSFLSILRTTQNSVLCLAFSLSG